MNEKEHIQSQIAQLQRRLELIEQAEKGVDISGIQRLDEIPGANMVAGFKRLYEECQWYLTETIKDGYPPKDGKHYIFELVMGLTLGDQVWDVMREATR
jgi:hypothetical protein